MSSGIRFEFDPTCLPEVMQSREVRVGLRARADGIVPRAKALARAEVGEEFAESIGVSEEVRPRGRPTAKVVADREDAEAHEFGTSNTERRRVLGRAARSE